MLLVRHVPWLNDRAALTTLLLPFTTQQVWIKYKRSHMAPQAYRIPKPAVSVADVMAMPAISALPSRSSSAWWNRPVTWQPQQHRAWQCFKQGYDPLSGEWQQPQQQQLEPSPAAEAALAVSEAAAGPTNSS